jgi:CRP-like cAMP-binding protein
VEHKFVLRSCLCHRDNLNSKPLTQHFLSSCHNLHEQIWAFALIMTRGKSLSDDLREVIINMACSLDIRNIINYTGCKRRTIERILSDYRQKGTVIRKNLTGNLRGRKRSLRARDAHVRPTILLM